MEGGSGDDILHVDMNGDRVVELADSTTSCIGIHHGDDKRNQCQR
jgi:hypothetical protein